jgi:hypothetical protein
MTTSSLKLVRKFIGVIGILAGLAWFIGHLGELRLFDVLYFVVFVILGLSHLTLSFGQEKTFVKYENEILYIKWFNKFRSLLIKAEDIDQVVLKRFEVIIKRKDRKDLALSLDNYETAQKKEIYEYFIDFGISAAKDVKRDF